jgi:hypothetical protein
MALRQVWKQINELERSSILVWMFNGDWEAPLPRSRGSEAERNLDVKEVAVAFHSERTVKPYRNLRSQSLACKRGIMKLEGTACLYITDTIRRQSFDDASNSRHNGIP